MKPITYAIVGCGGYTRGFLANLPDLPDWELVGLCDLNPANLEEKRQMVGLSADAVYTSEDALYASVKPDIVFVHTPLGAHYANCCRALEAGCHVWSQKPFVTNLTDGVDLVRRSAASGRWISVIQTARQEKTNLAIAEVLRTGRIGTPRFGHSVQYRERTKNLRDYSANEMWPVLNATAIHVFDLYRFWFGGRVKRVQFRGLDAEWNPYRDPGAATGWVEMESGVVMTWLKSFISHNGPAPPPYAHDSALIQGSEGAIRWGAPWFDDPVQLLRADADQPEIIEAPRDGFDGILGRLLKDLAAAVRDEGPVPCPAEDNLWSIACCMAATLSASTDGHPVDVLDLGRLAGLPEPVSQ